MNTHWARPEKTRRLYVRPAFGGRRIASIDWLEVELFVSSLVERGLSPKTCRDAVSVLSLIMKTAQRARVDGALLVDLWPELVLPRDLRAAWQPVIDSFIP